MTRSVWKGPFVDMYLIKKAENVKNHLEETMLLRLGLEDQPFSQNLLV